MLQGKEIPTQSGRAPKPGSYVISSGHVCDALTRYKDERRLRGDQRACGIGGMLRLQTGTLNVCPANFVSRGLSPLGKAFIRPVR